MSRPHLILPHDGLQDTSNDYEEHAWFAIYSGCTLKRNLIKYFSLRLFGCFFMFDRLFEENVYDGKELR
jgi:hypothetical protein